MVKQKDKVFTVNLYHDGVFIADPIMYVNGEMKQITDIDFEGMSFNALHDVVSHLVLGTVKGLYYCSIKAQLNDGIKELKTDNDVEEFLRVGYENKWFVNLYTEHNDYDVLSFMNAQPIENAVPYESSDDYYSGDDVEEIGDVDFYNEGEENVVIKNVTTQDPFLNKLCDMNGSFRGFIDEAPPVDQEPLDDPDAGIIDPQFNVKRGVSYPKHDPTIPWNQMQPVLGMRYEHPEQLKLALANYGVANGYQLWYMRNDWRCLLVYCGKNVEAGRCAGMYSNKKYNPVKKKLFGEGCSKDGEGSSKDGEGTSRTPKKKNKPLKSKKPKKTKKVLTPRKTPGKGKNGEGTSSVAENASQSPKWTKAKIAKDRSRDPVCGFRLWASWMSTEQSFQIKSLLPDHKCSRNYKLGSLVTYKWIAHQYAKEIIKDPFMPYIKMKDAIREKFLIDVSIGQCKREKQRALYDHEGGLIEHYGRLWDYRQALIDSNPSNTCRLDVEDTSSDKSYFKRFYICFKGLKEGWLEGCRRIIGLDGCFLKHTCRGELLTAMGRDANNQMYPIAWAVVRIENSENWNWFLACLHDDLGLQQGKALTLISDGHKGLHDAVTEILPNAEHRSCTRHIYANFKKKYSGVQLQRLFWHAASCTVPQLFYSKMEEMKQINMEAYDYLIGRNPNAWSRAFFNLNVKCPAFENGICESYHRTILLQRHKPIITMLEDIRVYLMQRIVAMHTIAVKLQDHITPTVRKKLEFLKREQRHWTVYASAYQLLEVRCGNSAYAVNLNEKTCACRLWQLSGIPCIHAVAGYMHLNKDPDEGVSQCYSQELWAKTYQHTIQPVLGTKMWKRSSNKPPLPPIVRTMPGRPRKERMKAQSENNSQVSRMNRVMRCSNCQKTGHNKATCKEEPVPKAPIQRKPPGRSRESVLGPHASARVRGRGRGGRGGRGGSGGRGGENGCANRGPQLMEEDDIRQNVEHEYMQQMLDEEEERRLQEERQYQEKLDEEAFMEVMAEQLRSEEMDKERERQEREEREWEEKNEETMDVDSYNRKISTINFNVHTQESVVNAPSCPNPVSDVDGAPSDVAAPSEVTQVTDKGKGKQEKSNSKSAAKPTRQSKRQRKEEPAPFRIYYKNRGRSERIAKLQGKNFKFDAQGTGSTPDKAFDVSESE